MDNISFSELIKISPICIPEIQRDYAQGRTDDKVKEIRNNFIDELLKVLSNTDEKQLVLDFIYGSTSNNEFTPLDGQQRLTTLFLLHWYLLPVENQTFLQKNPPKDDSSLFSYKTRISSKDFCNELIKHSLLEIKENIKKAREAEKEEEEKEETSEWNLSKGIKNEPWFLWSWRKDPTIEGMLVMLDAIDERLQFRTEDLALLWRRLIDEKKIVFHLLPLEKFNLTDELYVKMNARGKELSDFDIFKSTLEEQMRLNNVEKETQEHWQNNIDSHWIDIFWNKLAKTKIKIGEEEQQECVESVEKNYLRFLERMMVFHLFTREDCIDLSKFKKDDSDDIDFNKINRTLPFSLHENDDILAKLRWFCVTNLWEFPIQNRLKLLMPFLTKTQFFNQSFFQFVNKVFNTIIYKDPEGEKHDGSDLISGVDFDFKENNDLFLAFIDENINYDTRVLFYALLKFFENHSAEKVAHDETLQKELNEWMRVIRNLAINTNNYYYNSYTDFQNSLIKIKKWSENIYEINSETILDYLLKEVDFSGFDKSQLLEEKEKAILMTHPDSELREKWIKLIREIEEHNYFLGQIRFLLEWSEEQENISENKYNIEHFETYSTKIRNVFDEVVLSEEQKYLFNNALLTLHKYYLWNDCFMDNTKDRNKSWKRYLRESDVSKNIKMLLDIWNDKQKNFVQFCEEYINKNNPTDWRKCFIDFPSIYDILGDKKIGWWHWDDNTPEICLLTKTRWSSIHRELRTYYWFLKYRLENDRSSHSHEATPFLSVFHRPAGEFSVQFNPDTGYIVKSDFDTQIESMEKIEDSKWEQVFPSAEVQQVEELLEKINNLL